jgi:hypothetical protein
MNLIQKISILIVLLVFTACDHNKPIPPSKPQVFDPNVKPIINGNWYKPKVNTSWQVQLSKEEDKPFNTSYDVELYDIDLFDVEEETIKKLKQEGRKIICYFSAGSYENWRCDKNSFLESFKGEPLEDWEGERWLDIRNEKLAPIMLNRLDLAKETGCDGVDPDNIDAHEQSADIIGFHISKEDQLAYNKFLANEAHKRGLSIALKNDLSQVNELVDYFDFSVNEVCLEQKNCNELKPFIKKAKPVFNIEYNGNILNNACSRSHALGFNTLFMSKFLDDGFRYSCSE